MTGREPEALTRGCVMGGYISGVRTGPCAAQLDPATRTVTVSGDVEDSDIADLRSAIDAALDGSTSLTVDLSQVSYLPSVAIGALVRARMAAEERGATIELVAASGTVAQRVLEVCGIAHRDA